VIDSRDVIARIEELESERETLADAVTERESEYQEAKEDEAIDDAALALEDAKDALTAWDEDEGQELKTLQALADEASGCADWQYGETLIRDSYFQQYAEELADDCGMVDAKVSSRWPYTCIDWERAAEELQQDYTSVEYGDVTYWIRS